MLSIELAILREEDYDLNPIGFDEIELQRLRGTMTATLFRVHAESWPQRGETG